MISFMSDIQIQAQPQKNGPIQHKTFLLRRGDNQRGQEDQNTKEDLMLQGRDSFYADSFDKSADVCKVLGISDSSWSISDLLFMSGEEERWEIPYHDKDDTN